MQAQIAAALIRGRRPTRPQSRGGQHPVFEPLFRVDAQPVPESVNLQDLPTPLRMFTYARESKLSQAWQTQKHGPCRRFSPQTAPTHQNRARSALEKQRSSALCLVQVTTGAAVHAVYSSPEHLHSAFCTACGPRPGRSQRDHCQGQQAHTSAGCSLFSSSGLTHLTHTCLLHAAAS